MAFPDNLKQLRKEYKVTQIELAQAIGVNDRNIRRYEKGETEPTLSVLTAMADYFRCSVDYITGRTDSRA